MLIESTYKLKINLSKFLPLLIVTFFMLIFAVNLNIRKEDKKIDQLKSPLINQDIPKKPIRLFQKNEFIELKNVYNNLYAINFFASWCLPCKIEAPSIKLLSKKIPVFGVAFKDKKKKYFRFLTNLR